MTQHLNKILFICFFCICSNLFANSGSQDFLHNFLASIYEHDVIQTANITIQTTMTRGEPSDEILKQFKQAAIDTFRDDELSQSELLASLVAGHQQKTERIRFQFSRAFGVRWEHLDETATNQSYITYAVPNGVDGLQQDVTYRWDHLGKSAMIEPSALSLPIKPTSFYEISDGVKGLFKSQLGQSLDNSKVQETVQTRKLGGFMIDTIPAQPIGNLDTMSVILELGPDVQLNSDAPDFVYRLRVLKDDPGVVVDFLAEFGNTKNEIHNSEFTLVPGIDKHIPWFHSELVIEAGKLKKDLKLQVLQFEANLHMPEDLFRFTVPTGYTVVDGRDGSYAENNSAAVTANMGATTNKLILDPKLTTQSKADRSTESTFESAVGTTKLVTELGEKTDNQPPIQGHGRMLQYFITFVAAACGVIVLTVFVFYKKG